ncbi:MAG TPA: MoxR family ATPase [Mycobacteriales bacterium]|nr:MoxR family ATPase [Mycobacteriales bacterium]
MSETTWPIFTGHGEFAGQRIELPPAPSWRPCGSKDAAKDPPTDQPDREGLAGVSDDKVVNMVNAAITLRRPLLVTGQPGSGKSTLARLIARELGLGPVLRWAITSRSRLDDGLYDYDAIGRVHEENRLAREGGGQQSDIGDFIRLGPLGTALLPWTLPRVLLIDEIDKSDIDLPNELLHVFEDGSFTIREVTRLAPRQLPVRVMTSDTTAVGGANDWRADVGNGEVRCAEFPIVVMTSNGERDFPPAFLRRCLRLHLEPMDSDQLRKVVDSRISGARDVEELIERFEQGGTGPGRSLATDQLLNAVFVLTSANFENDVTRTTVRDALLAEPGTLP